jgi:ABC-type nitrate/sulfonate/bicarbonate transport system substrate-binding protein
MAAKSMTDVNQLRGKAGGVNRFGSNTDFELRLALRKNAIDPDKDVELIQVGGTAQMVAAISRGLIQFALFTSHLSGMPKNSALKRSSMGADDLAFRNPKAQQPTGKISSI